MIPVYEPLLNLGNEKKYLCEAIDKGEVSSQGSFVSRFEEEFAKWSGNKYAVAVCNGVAALETSIWSLRLENINIPVGTIISCWLAAIRAETVAVPRDNKPIIETNVMRVHLFGKLDTSIGFNIVDDCSQYWQPLEVQDVGCYSLFANKLITSGEGGIIVTNNKDIYERARSYRNLCHSEERFIHKEVGYNFRMSNIQSALALAQLEQIDRFIEIKQKNRDLYKKYLPEKVEIMFDVEVPWMYLIKTHRNAGLMVNDLKAQEIDCRRFFYPIHRQPCLNFTYPIETFPIANDLWEHAFYLPSGLTLTEENIKYICKTLETIL
jgi:perosamine synthetase